MRLKLMLYNVQDFFFRLAYPVAPEDVAGLGEAEWQLLAPDDVPMKPLAKLRGIAKVIQEEAPDVVMLCEAGGPESLANFSRFFLGDSYEPYATPGISDRGIETGFLVRKGLALRAELRSHAEQKVPFQYQHEEDPKAFEISALVATTLDLGKPEERRLSRDVPELRLYADGKAEPALVLLLAHLKSGFDPDGIDPQGAARRAAEVKALLAIHAAVKAALPPEVPVVIAGDLNGRAARDATAPEFAPVYQTTDLEDALEVAGVPGYERITHVTFFRRQMHASQLDYIFLPKALHPAVDEAATRVYRYRNEDQELQLPWSMPERWELPSDHYPVVCVLDLTV